MEFDAVAFGKYLRGLRRQQSQVDVEKASGVPQHRISAFERGEVQDPGIVTLLRLTTYYGLSPNDVARAMGINEFSGGEFGTHHDHSLPCPVPSPESSNPRNWTEFRRRDGRWCAERRDVTGQKEYVYGLSEAEVRSKIRADDSSECDDGYTFSAFLELWIGQHAEPVSSETSARRYRAAIAEWVEPTIGHLPLADITEHKLAYLISQIQSTGSTEAARLIRMISYRALEVAANLGLIPINPALPLRKRQHRLSYERDVRSSGGQPVPPSVYQYPQRLIWLLGSMLGLNASEIHNVRWSDIDLDHNRLTVRGSLRRVGSGHPLANVALNTESKRVVELPEEASESLIEHFENESLRGRGMPDDHLMFNDSGTRLAAHQIRRILRKLRD